MEQSKEYELYRDNVALLYRHFDAYMTNAMMFMTPLPFEVKYDVSLAKRNTTLMSLNPVPGPIPLGALFMCWREYPDVFSVETPSGRSFIFSFNGSPLSGSNIYSAVNLENGEITEGRNAPQFMRRCHILNEAIAFSRHLLQNFCENRQLPPEDFAPCSIEEAVQTVATQTNDK